MNIDTQLALYTDVVMGILIVLMWWYVILVIEKRLKKLEKRMDRLFVHISEPNSIIVPVGKPFITENGAVKIETKINNRFDKIEEKGIRFNLRLRNLEEKFDDEKLKALSNALDNRDHKQGKQIESNTQQIINIKKELKEIGKRIR